MRGCPSGHVWAAYGHCPGRSSGRRAMRVPRRGLEPGGEARLRCVGSQRISRGARASSWGVVIQLALQEEGEALLAESMVTQHWLSRALECYLEEQPGTDPV